MNEFRFYVICFSLQLSTTFFFAQRTSLELILITVNSYSSVMSVSNNNSKYKFPEILKT